MTGRVPRSTIVAIAGGSGAGKTTAVRRLASALRDDLVVLAQDSYYLDRSGLDSEARSALNFDHPDALDLARLAKDLEALAAGRAVEVPRYDFTTHTRVAATLRVEPREVVAVEGTLVLHSREVRRSAAIRVYLDADAETRLARRIERDGRERGRSSDDVRAQYIATVSPMHERFVEPQRRDVDLVIDANDERSLVSGVDTLLAMIGRKRSAVAMSCTDEERP